MKKHIIIPVVLLAALIFSGCSRDQFADLNTAPQDTQGKIPYVFTKALKEMNPNDYYTWFQGWRSVQRWSQVVAMSDGNTEDIAKMIAGGNELGRMIKVKREVESLKAIKQAMPAEEAYKYAQLEVMCNTMQVYLGIYATDAFGSIPYSETGKGAITGNFTPKYETQTELFDIWLKELEEAIKVLEHKYVLDNAGNQIEQYKIGNQDFVYAGDNLKWRKFANSLRLKIAVRLLHQDKAKAEAVVTEVMKYPLIEELADNFAWSPGVYFYGENNDFLFEQGSKNLLDFFVANKDPRVRFMFAKNDFNEEIITGFLKDGKKLPSYIDKVVNKSADGKSFASWKAPGEPWVRYFGKPVEIGTTKDSILVNDYYKMDNFRLSRGGKQKDYKPVSELLGRQIKTATSYTYPSLPDVTPAKDDTPAGAYYIHMSAAEVNLYLAELKALNFKSISGSVEGYYTKGVQQSVETYNLMAQKNGVPYYEKVLSGLGTDASISLKNGEINDLLQRDAYKLTGSSDEVLEKIYLQQYFHFVLFPSDLYVTVRRSGVPKIDSKIYPFIKWDKGVAELRKMPRRYYQGLPSSSSSMYDIEMASFEEQGFTPGATDGATLNAQRIWYDKGAPEYGKGPNIK